MQIARVIKQKGFTISKVAEQLGITQVTMSRNIAPTANPTVATLRKIADVVGCNVADFFADETKPELTTPIQEPAPTKPQAFKVEAVCPKCGEPMNIQIKIH